jgi:hypothetical protein
MPKLVQFVSKEARIEDNVVPVASLIQVQVPVAYHWI